MTTVPTYTPAEIPIHVAFRGFAHSDALEADVRERVAWLQQFYGRILSCRVLLEIPHRHRRDGRHVHVRIEVTVPGNDVIVVGHEPSPHAILKDAGAPKHHKGTEVDEAHRYASAAIHEAFDAARRRRQDAAREQRGAVKTHEEPASP